MTDPQKYIATLTRRRDFVLAGPTNSFALAERAALDWALVNLQPIVDKQKAIEQKAKQ